MFYKVLIVCYSLFFYVSKVNSYGSGAPSDFCEYTQLEGRNVILRPGHFARPQNPIPPNYQIQLNRFNRHSVRGKIYILCMIYYSSFLLLL